jgi:hypothetical protein
MQDRKQTLAAVFGGDSSSDDDEFTGFSAHAEEGKGKKKGKAEKKKKEKAVRPSAEDEEPRELDDFEKMKAAIKATKKKAGGRKKRTVDGDEEEDLGSRGAERQAEAVIERMRKAGESDLELMKKKRSVIVAQLGPATTDPPTCSPTCSPACSIHLLHPPAPTTCSPACTPHQAIARPSPPTIASIVLWFRGESQLGQLEQLKQSEQ